MLKIILWGFLIYFAFKFIFELVIPVTKTAKQIKKKMTEMQEEQVFQQQQSTQSQAQQAKSTATTSVKRDDYIEFEELK